MEKKSILKVENYFETFLILFLILFFLYLIKNFLLTIFLASIIVFFTYGFYNRISNLIKSKNISALIVLILILFIIIYPLYLLSVSLFYQTSELVNSGIKIISTSSLSNCNLRICGFLETKSDYINIFSNNILKNLENYITSSIGFIFSSLTNIIIQLSIFILSIFFLLRDGEKFVKYIKKIIPMKYEYKNAIFLRFSDVSKAVFVGTIFIALVQGFLVGLGLYFMGSEAPILWGLIASLFAILPLFGSAIVWFPISIYQIIIGNYYIGIAFLIYGFLIISTIDNLLITVLLNGKTKVHPLLILLTVLGGLEIFGFFGVFIGPIIVSLLISVLQLYKLDFN